MRRIIKNNLETEKYYRIIKSVLDSDLCIEDLDNNNPDVILLFTKALRKAHENSELSALQIAQYFSNFTKSINNACDTLIEIERNKTNADITNKNEKIDNERILSTSQAGEELAKLKGLNRNYSRNTIIDYIKSHLLKADVVERGNRTFYKIKMKDLKEFYYKYGASIRSN